MAPILRAIFALLIIATVASKLQASARRDPDMRAAVVDVLARQGIESRVDSARTYSLLGAAVRFRMPGCDGSIDVVPIELNLHQTPLLDAIVEPGSVRHFVYLTRTSVSADRIGMRLEWLKYKALSVLGLSPYETISVALAVVEPRGCQAWSSIEWRTVWDRQTIERALF